jgi:4-amino-4-deoxy-L-arabinose transferase-like glycosyltransferase
MPHPSLARRANSVAHRVLAMQAADSPARAVPRKALSLVAVLVPPAVFVAQGLAVLCYSSQTYDEAAYISAGYSYLARGDFRLMPEHPPLMKEALALPLYLVDRPPFEPDVGLWANAQQWPIARSFLYGAPVPAARLLTGARLVNLALGTLLLGLTGWWAYRLWGRAAALLAMALGCLEPSLVAHSALATVDVGTAFFWVLTLYLLWEYAGSGSVWARLGVGASTGAALATKYSNLLLLGLVGLGILLVTVRDCLERWRAATNRPGAVAVCLALGGVSVLLIGCAVLLVLGLAYLGEGLATWQQGLSLQRIHQHEGHAAFFWGQYSQGGWPYYFPVAFLIKTPVGSLFLITASLVLFRRGSRFGWRAFAFLLLPVAVYLAAFAFVRVNIGVRYLLPLYPLLFIAASRLATVRFSRRWLAPLLVGLPLALTALSAVPITPHQLAYFNELVGGPGRGHLYLSDSNIDWGQDLNGLRHFLEKEGVPAVYLSYFGTAPPAAYGVRAQYLPGYGLSGPADDPEVPRVARLPRQLLAVSVVNLQGVYLGDHDTYAWLREERAPLARIGYSIYVYDVTGDADSHRRLAEIYDKAGLPDLARAEVAAAQAAAGGTR